PTSRRRRPPSPPSGSGPRATTSRCGPWTRAGTRRRAPAWSSWRPTPRPERHLAGAGAAGTLQRVLTASGLEVAHGTRDLCRDVTLPVSPGRRVALVGPAGAGKPTLLGALIGRRRPAGGEVHRPRGCRVGYLPQELRGGESGTVLEEVLRGA